MARQVADSDLALAIAIAENSDSSQDDDFQLSTLAGQLCTLNKFAQPTKRQRKDQCLSKKKTVLQKSQRASTEGKENQYKSNRRDGGIPSLECKLSDPPLSQVRKPLAARKSSIRKGTPPSCSAISRGEFFKEQEKEDEATVNKAKTHRNVSTNLGVDLPPETNRMAIDKAVDCACIGSAKSSRADPPKVSVEDVLTLKDIQACCKEDAVKISFSPHPSKQEMAEMPQILSPNRSFTTVQGPLCHPESNNGTLLVGVMEENAAVSSMDDAVSLAEEEGPSSLHINSDSQFNALMELCIDNVSDNDEEDRNNVNFLGSSLATEDASLMAEELISSLMTQNTCRESLVSCDPSLQCIDLQSITPDTESATINLVNNFHKTCLEAQNLSAEGGNCSDHEQVNVEEKPCIEGIPACTEPQFEQPLECPVCGTCITVLSFEQREVHTNACLDSIDRKETPADGGFSFIDMHQMKLDGKSELGECVQEPCLLDLTPVLRWLETLNLSRYADVFVREEIDWDTLKFLTDEDLCTLGITALGPRRKILYSIQQLERGMHENAVSTTNEGHKEKHQVETDSSGRKLITDFYELPSSLQGKLASGPQTEPENKDKGGSRGVAAQKRESREVGGMPEWMSIPGTKFRVDAFQHLRGDCSHWFLTHFHTDHYQGLTRAFRYGHIYCSAITAQLVNMRIGVPWERLKPLPLNQMIEIDGIKVTLIDANHCPGSVMILFEPQNGKAVLHTGDFRFCEDIANVPVLQTCNIHTLMLDTTYCNPQYDFPKQEVVIQFIIDAIQAEAFNLSTLFLIGTYTIGKEKIFFEVARALQKKIYCSATKLRLLQCMNFPDEDMRWLTTNDQEAHIHIVPLWSIANFKRMSYIIRHNNGRYNSIVSFSPTGWSFGRGKKRTPGRRWQQGTIVRYEVPYSEHCSFKELKEFVKFINPVNIIPSVHNDSAEAADALIALLLNEEDDD